VGASTLEELKKGRSSLEKLTIHNGGQFYLTPDVHWDGTYLALVDTETTSSIFQFAISGKIATLVNATKINGDHNAVDSWIQGQTLIVPESGRPSQVLYYGYPAGGKPTKHFSGAGDSAWGATVSVASP
jgi:hypothetical protein